MSGQPFVSALLVGLVAGLASAGEQRGKTAEKISYFRQIRPILQVHCHGCHQPAKASGGFAMTTFRQLLQGGESETPPIVRGAPEESYLVELITPSDGEAEMPQGKPPLAAAEIDLIRKWIAAGAADDTPATGPRQYDQDHPPVYRRPPVITSLDYAPDGTLLAVAGFHEVLLLANDSSQQVARLVGMSERIETVRFSPDGRRLLVTGGLPGRVGEVQIWDVNSQQLQLSVTLTNDTVYGGSWSPDGKRIAVGCGDNAVRALDAATGREVVYMAAHDDLVRDTAFSRDGKSIFSVSRDKTAKMTDVKTQRFLGNLTTHTPGILRGGINSIDRHPVRNQVVIGGADGAPKLFKMDVKAAPAGGGNPNQIRQYEQMPGRIFAVCFHPDGTRLFAASSLDGAGQVAAFETDTGKVAWRVDVPESGTYAIRCAANGKTLATGGADGWIRIIDTASGAIAAKFLPVAIATDQTVASRFAIEPGDTPQTSRETLGQLHAKPTAITALAMAPDDLTVASPVDYVQLLLSATLSDGRRLDVTRSAHWTVTGDVGSVSTTGVFRPVRNGTGMVAAELAGQRLQRPVRVTGLSGNFEPDFIHDVNPVLSRVGCNAGTCHGAAKGKNGFKLSLRGYDPLLDVRSLTDDLAARRVNVAAPAHSLALLKATAAVPHQGGQVLKPGSCYYATVRGWIAAGAKLDRDTPRVAKIAIAPTNPVVHEIGQRQQVRVMAMYTDGTTRDVTHEAVIDSGNTEVATARPGGLIAAVRRGEAPVLARYEGAYAATTLTVMGDRTGFIWEEPETWGQIDTLVAAKWKRMKIRPSKLCSDTEFIRRVYLDLTGLPPTADAVRQFIADSRSTRIKRDALIDQLIGSEDYIEYWTNKWADLLQVNRKYLGAEGAAAFRRWIRAEVAANTPYDVFAHKILVASGSNRENPPASYFKILRTPAETMENTTQLFLAIRFSCNKCHDHPFERWTQDQYYQTAAFFARLDLRPDPAAGGKKIGGTAVEGAKPLYEIIADKPEGEVVHDRTKKVTAPKFPFRCHFEAPAGATRRQQLAAWITSPDNPYFARSYVNRLWGYLLGVGMIEPLDDVRAGNPPTNPELIDYLTDQLIDSGFNVRHVQRRICQSRTYQLSIETNRWNADDRVNYSHAIARRLPAEVLYDAIYQATGAKTMIPGLPPGTRAATIPDSGIKLPDGFLASLGRPARESVCECERSSGLQLGPVMSLISGPTVGRALADPNNALVKLAAAEVDVGKLADAIFLRVLNRPATPAEQQAAARVSGQLPTEHRQLVEKLHELEARLAPTVAERQRQRREAITAAQQQLADYQQQIAPHNAQLDRQQQQRIAAAEQVLRQQEAALSQRLAEWEETVRQPTAWTTLDPIELASTNHAKLVKQDDLSVVASGANGKTTYTVVARTEQSHITGVKLELRADPHLPMKGPGRAPNGNFVLTELRAEWATEQKPETKAPIAFDTAQADFSQAGYAVKTAIDGKRPDRNNGWATAPKIGQNRTAVFQTAQDIGTQPGLLTLHLDQLYQDGRHTIGRFRISVTSSPRPITLNDLPQKIAEILAVPAADRTAAQRAELLRYYRGIDREFQKVAKALAEAKRPRPIDARLKRLRDRVAKLREPLPEDPRLIELRHAVKLSAQQLANQRLVFAQDLAWALINSPAFLFNH